MEVFKKGTKENIMYKILTLLLLTISISFSDPIIAVLPVNGYGFSESELIRIGHYFRREVEKRNKDIILEESIMFKALNDSTCNDINCAKEIGEKLNIQYIAQSKVAKIDSTIYYNFRIVNTQNNKVVMVSEGFVENGFIETLMVQYLQTIAIKLIELFRVKPL